MSVQDLSILTWNVKYGTIWTKSESKLKNDTYFYTDKVLFKAWKMSSKIIHRFSISSLFNIGTLLIKIQNPVHFQHFWIIKYDFVWYWKFLDGTTHSQIFSNITVQKFPIVWSITFYLNDFYILDNNFGVKECMWNQIEKAIEVCNRKNWLW